MKNYFPVAYLAVFAVDITTFFLFLLLYFVEIKLHYVFVVVIEEIMCLLR